MVNKNLFLHDLAVVAILKCEAPYLKEWLDYHLFAGVDHFYLYDNESPDNQAEVAKPYVDAGLVTYIPFPGQLKQMPAYNDAFKKFKFQCRYMAFIDLDEFILPKSNRSIAEVVDEILSNYENAAGLAINWQLYGSNGQETADYSRGVLERFTRRAQKNFENNTLVKTIANPRAIDFVALPHYVNYFKTLAAVNENGEVVPESFSEPVSDKKIVVNHYHCKSREEFEIKLSRGRADVRQNTYNNEQFKLHDRNEVFDDGILKYRVVRAENFSIESRDEKLARVIETLTETLTAFNGDMETALTCRAVATFLRERFPADADYWAICEQSALTAIINSLADVTPAEAQLFIRDLPNILSLPYPAAKTIRTAIRQILSQFINAFGSKCLWKNYVEFDYVRDLLNLESDNFVER